MPGDKNQMKITAITIMQLQKIIDVYMNTFNNSNWNENWEFADTEKRLTDIIKTPGFTGLAVIDEDKLVGMVLGNIQRYCNQNHYNLQEMCVVPDYRSKGIGSFLLSELQKTLTEKGVSKIYLLTERDSLAEKFYIKNDFYKSNKIQVLGKIISKK
jgi:aminoglycoside 6'-N-acetyltransferase I